MDGNFEVLPVSLVDDGGHLLGCDVVLGRDLDDIHVVEGILADGLPCLFGVGDLQKLLLHDGRGESGIETLDIASRRSEFTAGGENSRARDASRVDGVPQRNVAIDAGVAEIAHRREATLQIFAC